MVRSMYPSPEEFRTTWASADTRAEALHELAKRGIDFDELAAASGQGQTQEPRLVRYP